MILLVIVIAVAGVTLLLLFLPLKGKSYRHDVPVRHVDERDTMFSRNELIPGSDRYNEYYSRNPGKLEADDLFREAPGLLDKDASFYNSKAFASADASFELVTAFYNYRKGGVATTPVSAATDSGSAATDSDSATTAQDSVTTDSDSVATPPGSAATDSGSATTDSNPATTAQEPVTTDSDSAATTTDSAAKAHSLNTTAPDSVTTVPDSVATAPGPAAKAHSLNPTAPNPSLTSFLKNWCLKMGALSSGVALMQPYHYYIIGGRRERYGMEVKPEHRYGIAFTVEMDYELVSTAPRAGIILESAREYLQSGMLATQLAMTLRNLGYSATTHIDGNYDVICPLVARDAGLGEIGRMGLLITPRLGPRVRIAVVTTDAPLLPDTPVRDNTVIDFCTICAKCARVCPSASIPEGGREEVTGGLRWKIDQESCYTYWCRVGTDCGRCMAVCPYSHPGTPLHNFIRWGIRNNFIFRRAAVWLDDLFYGRKPSQGKMPGWLKVVV